MPGDRLRAVVETLPRHSDHVPTQRFMMPVTCQQTRHTNGHRDLPKATGTTPQVTPWGPSLLHLAPLTSAQAEQLSARPLLSSLPSTFGPSHQHSPHSLGGEVGTDRHKT